MLDPILDNIFGFNAALLFGWLELAFDYRVADFVESRFFTDRAGGFAAQFDAVVFAGIMAGSNHGAAREAEVADHKINHIAGDFADVPDIIALRLDTFGQ